MLKDSTALAHVIKNYAHKKQLIKGKKLHAQLICTGYQPCIFVQNHLLNMYFKCGEISFATLLFDIMPQRNIVSWTAMITGFLQNRRSLEALKTFSLMRFAGEKPTQFAFSSVIQASTDVSSIVLSKQLHSLTVKSGVTIELFVGSNLADMYAKCGFLNDACKIFDEMPFKDEVTWTSMIDGYTKNGNFDEAFCTFKSMVDEGIAIDQHVFCSTLGACAALENLKLGKSLHSCIVKGGFVSDVIVGNALTDLYAKSGDMESASSLLGFDSEVRNVVSYTSLIDGYVEMEQTEKAFSVFVELKRQGIEPNEFTYSSLIKACACQAVLEQGQALHAQVTKTCSDKDPFVSAGLVDMYGKCGLFKFSSQVFNGIRNPTKIAWNSLLSVYAQHGFAKEAVRFFEKMTSKGVKPNEITFVSLLIGCSHNGFIEEGLNYFYSMEKIYGVKPQEEHYSCVIDLLGRAGRLKEAEDFINKMPFEPNAFGWCSFLGACRTYGDKGRGEFAAEKLKALEPDDSGTHILLSKIYASEGHWEGVRNVRKMMRDEKMKKLPGYSWVDVGNKTHTFGAEDWSHPRVKEIYDKLDSLLNQIKEAGYVAQTESVPCNIEESLKERHLHHHSERIAVAFALISIPIEKPIIVKKNLRICIDCHSALKFISKVVGRKLIVRDKTRFHHFDGGSCSCGNYW